MLVLAGIGLLAAGRPGGCAAGRGVATVLALAIGCTLTAVVAWQVGELLGTPPTAAELAEVGNVVTTSLTLGSPPGLAMAPFAAVLAYLVGVLYVAEDGLGRSGTVEPPPTVGRPPLEERQDPVPATARTLGRGPLDGALVHGHRGRELLQRHRDGAQLLQQGELAAQQPRLGGQPPAGGRLGQQRLAVLGGQQRRRRDQAGQRRRVVGHRAQQHGRLGALAAAQHLAELGSSGSRRLARPAPAPTSAT